MNEKPIWPTGQWREALKTKDAEIERLKKVISLDAVAIGNKNRIITELCDALETRLPFTRVGVEAIDAEFDLVHRAREATR